MVMLKMRISDVNQRDERVLIGKTDDRRRISRKARSAWLLSGDDQNTSGDEAPMYGQGARVAMVQVLNADETDELNAASKRHMANIVISLYVSGQEADLSNDDNETLVINQTG